MHCWHDVKPTRITPENFLSLIEISKGSKNKYELDKETGHLILDRVLFTSTIYPQNYGFIPRTFARDYDPLDVLVLCSESILPMSFVRCSPIGVLIMTDNGLPDEKIIAVCNDDPFYKDFKDMTTYKKVDNVALRKNIEESYKMVLDQALEDAQNDFENWKDDFI